MFKRNKNIPQPQSTSQEQVPHGFAVGAVTGSTALTLAGVGYDLALKYEQKAAAATETKNLISAKSTEQAAKAHNAAEFSGHVAVPASATFESVVDHQSTPSAITEAYIGPSLLLNVDASTAAIADAPQQQLAPANTLLLSGVDAARANALNLK